MAILKADRLKLKHFTPREEAEQSVTKLLTNLAPVFAEPHPRVAPRLGRLRRKLEALVRRDAPVWRIRRMFKRVADLVSKSRTLSFASGATGGGGGGGRGVHGRLARP